MDDAEAELQQLTSSDMEAKKLKRDLNGTMDCNADGVDEWMDGCVKPWAELGAGLGLGLGYAYHERTRGAYGVCHCSLLSSAI